MKRDLLMPRRAFRAAHYGLWCCVGLVLVPAVATPATEDKTRAYLGSLDANRHKGVEFRVSGSRTENLTARFRVERVDLVCEDGTFPEVDLGPITAEFIDSRAFQEQRYRREANRDWSYFEVKGRLIGQGRARGYIYYVEDPYDPPGTPNRPECNTGGGLYYSWTAERVR